MRKIYRADGKLKFNLATIEKKLNMFPSAERSAQNELFKANCLDIYTLED